MSDNDGSRCLRIAAAGDVHCSEQHRDEIVTAVEELSGKADLVLFAGDLTTHGEPEQGAVRKYPSADLSRIAATSTCLRTAARSAR